MININEVIENVSVALKEFSELRTKNPIRTALPFNKKNGTALVMPSMAETLGILGLKVVTVVPNNYNRGEKTINGNLILSDFETGEPLALLEGSHITTIRTGALSGVATKYFSRKNSKILSIIGKGEQAKGLAEAVLAVRDIKEIMLFNHTKS